MHAFLIPGAPKRGGPISMVPGGTPEKPIALISEGDTMTESRLRGLTVEELDAVVGGAKNGQVTTTSVINGPGPHDTTVTSGPTPYGQFKKG